MGTSSSSSEVVRNEEDEDEESDEDPSSSLSSSDDEAIELALPFDLLFVEDETPAFPAVAAPLDFAGADRAVAM